MIRVKRTENGESKVVSMDERTWGKILKGFPTPAGVKFELASNETVKKELIIQPDDTAKKEAEKKAADEAAEKEAAEAAEIEAKEAEEAEKLAAEKATKEAAEKEAAEAAEAEKLAAEKAASGTTEKTAEEVGNTQVSGDVNGDGKVDGKDLSIVHKGFAKEQKEKEKKRKAAEKAKKAADKKAGK